LNGDLQLREWHRTISMLSSVCWRPPELIALPEILVPSGLGQQPCVPIGQYGRF
jgi:hypothetical protein